MEIKATSASQTLNDGLVTAYNIQMQGIDGVNYINISYQETEGDLETIDKVVVEIAALKKALEWIQADLEKREGVVE